jgi:transcriptional regulator with XRE-family HTH domain
MLVKNIETTEQRAAARVRALRVAMSLSQGALAIEMRQRGYSGWTQSTIAKLEAASRPLRVNELADLAAVLRTTVPVLLGDMSSREAQRSTALTRLLNYIGEGQRLHVKWEALKGEVEQISKQISDYHVMADSARKELVELGCVEVGLDGGLTTWVFPEDVDEINDAKVVAHGQC